MGRFVGRVSVLGVVVLVSGLLSVVGVGVSAGPAVAADAGCAALGGVEVAGPECQVSGAVTPVWPVSVGMKLHLLATAHLDGSLGGVDLTVSSGDLVMDAGAVIEADDDNVATPNTGASPVKIDVQNGSLLMAAGSRISADNNDQAGAAGNITITVPKGDMVMSGTAGSDQCRSYEGKLSYAAAVVVPAFYSYSVFKAPSVYGDSSLGAVISAHRWGGGDAGPQGALVQITVGNYGVPPSGTMTMDRCSLVDVSSVHSGGEIKITAGRTGDFDGLILSESGQSGAGNVATQLRGGGPINVRAGCELTVSDTGMISSKGQDPGADLVHLKGCTVLIQGIVQSTAPGAGHVLPAVPPNLCNDDNVVAHPLGNAGGFTGCVRILGQTVTIDASGTHNGNVNVDGIRGGDTAPGRMRGWIDIFSTQDTTILGDPVGTSVKWAVSANACPPPANAPCSNAIGGVITIKAIGGKVHTEGQAILQANATANGGDGGMVTIQAGGTGTGTGTPLAPDPTSNIELDASFIEANGPTTSDNIAGGTINIKSFWGSIIGAGGHIFAKGGNPADGTITLEECSESDSYAGTVTADTVTETRSVCAGTVTVPADAQALFNSNAPIWFACEEHAPPIKSGMKFNDLDNSGSFTPGDTPIQGWPITLYDTQGGIVQTTTTAADGTYEFFMDPGTYRVCEGSSPLPGTWVQTYPQLSTTPPNANETIYTQCPAPNVNGYQFTANDGDNLQHNDFGNRMWCEKLPVQQVLDPVTGQYPGNKGPDKVVRVDLGESVQTAVTNAADTNGDGSIIIAVSAHADGTLGGSANQNVAVTKDYGTEKPFALIGCSVTLTGGGASPAVWVKSTASSKEINVNGRATQIFVMDIHGGKSAVGVQADGTKRYLRNEYGNGNTGTGISVNGSYNTVHNGEGSGNAVDGVYVNGGYNLVTDTKAMSNGKNGLNVAGGNNQLLKLNAGEKGTGNGTDGVHVAGNTNTLSEISAYANGGDGIDVAGNSNVLTKNLTGDKGKGNKCDGIKVVGYANRLEENKSNTNTLNGFNVSGGTSSNVNNLKKNVSNSGNSGSADTENAKLEYQLAGYVKNDGGGNKADNVVPPKPNCTTFPATNSTVGVAVNCE